MEIRVRILFLGMVCLCVFAGQAGAQEQTGETGTPLGEIIQTEPVLQPEVKRREITEAAIDTENYELGVFTGILSIEDFGTDPVYGVRLLYHVTEDLFVEGTIGMATAGKTSIETFSGGIGTILSEDQRDYTYYSVAIGYNVLPGEAFLGRNTAFNTSLYLVAGVGSTDFAGDERFTITLGGGYSVTLTDWLALHLGARTHIYNIDVTGEDKDVNDLEMTLGLNYFF